MAGNSFGERFRITTFGESHGGGLGVVVDGCPAGMPFPHEVIAAQLARRRPGVRLASARKEPDAIEILSGVDPESGRTLGTPLTMIVRNVDAVGEHYDDLRDIVRPSHADYTTVTRFGLRAVAGGGRASARETVARVAAGALAEVILARRHGIEIVAWVASVSEHVAPEPDLDRIVRGDVDAHDTRCPDEATARAIESAIIAARKGGDTLGGVVRCIARNVPAGLGEPVFGKLTADLAAAMMSLPASRGFEIGEGFAATRMRGSTHNDAFIVGEDGKVHTRTNHSGGIQGGISNGETLSFSVAFKPVATIFMPQDTVRKEGDQWTPVTNFVPRKGRHDPCVLPRAVPIVEAMTALVLCDHVLRRAAIRVDELP